MAGFRALAGRLVPAAAAVGVGAAPQDSEAMFLGRMARNADHMMLDIAQKMEDAGINRGEIWRKTGWGRGADDAWRWEIDDNPLEYESVPTPWDNEPGSYMLPRGGFGDAVHHPELLENYPAVGDWRVTQTRGYGGEFTPWDGFNTRLRIGNRDSRSVMAHELQHGVQDLEGFALGGSPGEFLPQQEAMASMSDGDRVIRDAEAMDKYHRLAGENEARNVESRLFMSPSERRATPPWETQDFPEDQQLIRREYGADPQAARGFGAPPATGNAYFNQAHPGGPMKFLEALDLPTQGIYGLLRGGYGRLVGEKNPMQSAARVAEQPLGLTAEQLGDWIFERTNSPAASALGYGVAQMWGPI